MKIKKLNKSKRKSNMKNKMQQRLIVLTLGFFLFLAFIFLLFNSHMKLVGFVVYNDSSGNQNQSENITNIKNITQQDALLAINESEQIIQEMSNNNFSILYMNDSLIEAKRVFQQAKYAEILRGDVNASELDKSEARKALILIKWEDIHYKDVLVYTNEIKNREKKAFLLRDEITLEESKINITNKKLSIKGLFKSRPIEVSNETRQILEDAKFSFQEGRYNDTERFLEEFRNSFEQEISDASTLSQLKNGAKNFFQRYWIYILIFLILLLIAGYFIYKKHKKKSLEKKIKKMKVEEGVLVRLMKKAQDDRFNKNAISGLVYNIRMREYKARMQEIKKDLPVFEKRLKRY